MKVVRGTLAALQPARMQVAVCMLSALAACSFDDSTNKWLCKVNADCVSHGNDYECGTESFCVKKRASSQPGKSDASTGASDGAVKAGDGATDAAAKDGSTTQPACTKADFCFDGKTEQSTKGACKAGMRQCENGVLGDCLGQVLPVDEICNGVDDDCDGKVDEDLAMGTCTSDAKGACNMGTLTCDKGVPHCLTAVEAGPELCDGIDNDCDGMTDEGTDELCYPATTAGCLKAGDSWSCMGVCTTGKRLCQGGMLQACASFVQPAAMEVCNASGIAADDNCNGTIDEGCTCSGSVMHDCYSGRAGTDGVGLCHHGTQTCSGSTFGACTGETVPKTEACANEGADDDCNGTADDVPGKDAPCTDTNATGVCRSGTEQCVTGNPELVCVTTPKMAETCNGLDDDCNGTIDDNFDLQSDAMHCGSCTNACATGQTCCSGQCVDTQSDDNHCGMCTMAACGSGLNCCAGSCKNQKTDESNCGTCGNDCGAGDACCGGTCTATQTDRDNCGSCGHQCTAAQDCCAGACVNLKTDNKNCGKCGNNCGLLGATCTCSTGQCKAPLLGLCL